MELHYIWIKKFRNLEDQHLNFTGKYKLEFTKKGLNLIENKSYVPNDFFGKGISNISAIVGKNGTGKSNILDLVTYLFYTPKSVDSEFVFIYGGKEGLWGNGINIIYKLPDSISLQSLNNDYNKIHYEQFDATGIDTVYFSNIQDWSKKRYPKGVIDISNNFNTSFVNRYKDNNFVSELDFFESGEYLNLNFTRPNFIQIKLINLLSSSYERQQRLSNNFIGKTLEDYRARIVKSTSQEVVKYWLTYSIINEAYSHFSSQDNARGYRTKSLFEEDEILFDKFDSFIKEIDLIDDVRKKHSFILDKFPIEDFPNSKIKTSIKEILSLLRSKINGDDFEIKIEGKRNTRTDTYIVPFNSDFSSLIRSCNNLFNNTRPFSFSFYGLSSGHKAFLNLFSRFIKIAKEKQSEELIVLIDEGELYFHPQWQKEFISRIVNLFNSKFVGCKTHIILTSHSPFIVSDLPKSNILFLDEANHPESISIDETFGANIMDLYRQTFFLKKGTMGDFSFSKISELVESIINDIREDKNIENKLKLIGDNLIKAQLVNIQKNKNEFITNSKK